ncbi:Major facilitator superfamily protein [Hibiscus syriacus]|uniref:Major facilitator superfamily protein n=1 Tax=Hibiscus syriacus TaxID=106335 RepID=A0A6A2Z7C9_HIBSY|nr:Major facilitator superfamily protein [Hibiscus syriacus]
MCARNSLYTNPKPCKHLADYKLRRGFDGYDSLQNCLKTTPKEELDHILLHTQSEKGHELCQQVKDLPGGKNNGFEVCWERSSKRKRLDSGIGLDLKKSKLMILMRDRRAKSCYPLGLRGLNIWEYLFHEFCVAGFASRPSFEEYFLSDRHNSVQCRKRSGEKVCLLCDIDALSLAMFSGDRTPYSPAQFLYSWWQHSLILSSYEEQDAHEFFISVLDVIHEKESKMLNSSKDDGDCQCIAHRAFSGLLRSDVSCISCGFTSTTYDPCVDISLNLDTSSMSPSNVANKPIKADEKTGVSTFRLFEFVYQSREVRNAGIRSLRDLSATKEPVEPLFYKANEDLSCVRISPCRDPFSSTAGCSSNAK